MLMLKLYLLVSYRVNFSTK